MLDEKLKVIEEILCEIFVNKIDECDVPPTMACLILKSIESRVQDKAIAELSLRALKMEQQEKSDGIKEDVAND